MIERIFEEFPKAPPDFVPEIDDDEISNLSLNVLQAYKQAGLLHAVLPTTSKFRDEALRPTWTDDEVKLQLRIRPLSPKNRDVSFIAITSERSSSIHGTLAVRQQKYYDPRSFGWYMIEGKGGKYFSWKGGEGGSVDYLTGIIMQGVFEAEAVLGTVALRGSKPQT